MTERDELVGRVRALLSDESTVREVSMFGGRSFMVDEKMVVAARDGGGLLVRVDAARHDELVAMPGAGQAQMGAGRDMGPGWIEVAAGSVASEDALSFWLATAVQYRHGTNAPG